ncbi:hypothetical protein [Enterococcus gallinarum]|uniref:hypothetical protein n=1 Tax=Enterococcus gallinarum TaxID=1353 RepID=UPI0012E13684|nr:hypothetical protein [Enterococcus gallinarum]MUO33716.1 hypothetical protein [Enterococcus gallinarum]
MKLVLPNNYVEVTEEEMMYLDGGFSLPNAVVATGINAAINWVIGFYTGGSGLYMAKAFIRRVGSGAATRAFTYGLSRFVQTQIANRVSGIIVGTLLGAGSLSLGGVAAKYFDQRDKHKNNGWCDI